MPGDDLIPPSPSYDPAEAPPDDSVFYSSAEPLALFEAWLSEARTKEPNDPNAMALATADASGAPNVRMVLLKGVDAGGFTFYSNSESAKGEELGANARAALCFHWKSLRRQVRVRGPVELVSEEEANAYFQTRDRGARLGAWASAQSHPLPDRLALEKRVAEYALKFGIGTVPKPPFWNGYRVVPLEIEFWRNRPFRLHDRLVFSRADSKSPWTTERLFP